MTTNHPPYPNLSEISEMIADLTAAVLTLHDEAEAIMDALKLISTTYASHHDYETIGAVETALGPAVLWRCKKCGLIKSERIASFGAQVIPPTEASCHTDP